MEEKSFDKHIHNLNLEIIKGRVNENNTIEEYISHNIKRKLSPLLSTFSNEKLEGATKKILSKKHNLTKEDVIKLNKAIKTSSVSINETIFPIEKIIHDFSCELMSEQKSHFISEHESETSRLKKFVKQMIENVKYSNSYEYSEILETQIKKLGNIDNINSSLEGVVFVYRENNYKITGSYAPINKIKNLSDKIKKEHTKGKQIGYLKDFIKGFMLG